MSDFVEYWGACVPKTCRNWLCWKLKSPWNTLRLKNLNGPQQWGWPKKQRGLANCGKAHDAGHIPLFVILSIGVIFHAIAFELRNGGETEKYGQKFWVKKFGKILSIGPTWRKIVQTPTQRQLNNNSTKVGFDTKMTLQTTHRLQELFSKVNFLWNRIGVTPDYP